MSAFVLSSLIAASAVSVNDTEADLRIDSGNPAAAWSIVDLRLPNGAESFDATAQQQVISSQQDPTEVSPQRAVPAEVPYGTRAFVRQSKSIPWRLGGAAAAITITGIANWKWGSSSFHFHSEGWFGKGTANGGMDKLGHAWSSFVLTEFFTDGINGHQGQSRSASYTAAILAMGLMTYIEIFDGLSEEHGFSFEDLTVDGVGTFFSVGRRAIPGLRDKLDFRLLYLPTHDMIEVLSCFPRPQCDRNGETARSVITDYSGQRYILALKLSGFEPLQRTPLRLLELHGGYYARGFTKDEQTRGDPRRRHLFVGLGLNVGQLLLGNRPKGAGKLAKSIFEYVQVPYTAAYSN